jgi:hypothetical protein
MLRVKSWEREAFELLDRLHDELQVATQPQTAGFVPISIDRPAYREAEDAVVRVLDQSGIDWRQHLELRV